VSLATSSSNTLSNEALVYVIRDLRGGDKDTLGRLMYELGLRVARIAKKWAKGFDPETRDTILQHVEDRITDLVFADQPTRESEFLEVGFSQKVKGLTLNAVVLRKQAPQSFRASDRDDDSARKDDPAERVQDERPRPDEVLAALEDVTRRPELIRRAREAVRDPRHYEAALLHYGRGWPIYAKDPATPCLARRFGVSERQVRNWLAAGLEAMRAAIGEEK
jgi:hypothetical protein